MHLQSLIFVVSVSLICVTATVANDGYRLPPKALVDLIDAAPSPGIDLSPDGEWMLVIEQNAMPDIGDISKRMLRLAGMRIDPVAKSRFRTSYDRGLLLRQRGDAANEMTVRVPLPKGAKLGRTVWAHDSKSFAFTIVSAKGSELWAATVAAPANPKLLTDQLNTVLCGFQWMPDAKSILCCMTPSDHGDEPTAPRVPSGPNIQESSGNNTPTRTYQDLLTNAHDEAMFAHYTTTQLAVVDLDGKQRKLGEPAIFYDVEASPDGQHILVTTVERPFSYLMTVGSFPKQIEVWNAAGQKEHLVAAVPMEENIPIEGVRVGPRSASWISNEEATLIWTEAQDGGDPNVEAEHRDQWMSHAAPFKDAPHPLVKVEHRAVGVSHTQDSGHLITYEYDRDRRWLRVLLHNLQDDQAEPIVLTDRSIRDRYGDPGRLVSETNEHGHSVVKQHEKWVYRAGAGASPQGSLPFLDRQNIETLETERLWRCEAGSYERPVKILKADDSSTTFVTSHQSPTSPPNYFLHRSETRTALTDFPDPTPQIRGIKKQLVKYERADGVELSATMYLPADYVEGTKLPLLVWAYPIEFNDADTAGQVGSSPWMFTRIRGSSHLALVTQGYAVMDGATIPIIGDPETMNDTFIEQMVASAKAAIDKAVEMGIAERHRVAAGGHSYGAFMTANLMAHSDLFQAGVARSGAYNRTLTPFGFQSERRPLWEAKEVYNTISPFMHADKIKEPLLLIHGENDNNSGTFPIQSKRLFQAIKGNGGTTRLVMLPKESHGYRARESVLHVQAETVEWLDKYVKHHSGEESDPKAKPL
jgi:dipeptidyl aminopeptidase/acylaminoacyl peptidase